jgi:hypothetical protein
LDRGKYKDAYFHKGYLGPMLSAAVEHNSFLSREAAPSCPDTLQPRYPPLKLLIAIRGYKLSNLPADFVPEFHRSDSKQPALILPPPKCSFYGMVHAFNDWIREQDLPLQTRVGTNDFLLFFLKHRPTADASALPSEAVAAKGLLHGLFHTHPLVAAADSHSKVL